MKHYTVIITPRAERQLNALYVRIADDSGEARADNYIDGIVADCLSLSTFPERGTKRDDIRPNLRTKGYARRVTIAFSVNVSTEIVAIHGVFYGGQDFEQLLRGTDSDD
jgi:toxin ParE1/3/4